MSLELTNIVKSFKDDLVLDGVSLTVEKGQTLVLFGASGAGKTVMLRLIAGVIEPDTGTIRIDGEDMQDVEPEYRGIGMAFQNFALFPHMDARDNIASPLTARRQTKDAIRSKVEAIAKLLKIDHVLGHQPKELSNGQKQRTALARALAGEPALLLLDDPLRNVDAKLRFEMRLELPRLLKDQNATVVYVTQDYKEAMALGDNIAVMNGGGIQQLGTPEDIYLRPAHLDIAKLFGDPVINLLDVIPERAQGHVQISLSDQALSLPDHYAHVVGESCVLGVRPETVRFVDQGTPGSFQVLVEAETPLNEKTVTLVLTSRKREIMVSRPAGTPGPVSGTAYVTLDLDKAVLFEKSTGNLIEAVSIDGRLHGEVA
ncbi:MAG: multiple sugar transport system ATP-binding protein [Pseudomonadales bacterium]|jgi:multiple sugar transport system ATP-binding protein